MSTRCVIRIKRGDVGSVDLYHHCDGYPEYVGMKLLETIERYFEGKPKDCEMWSEELANRLVKNTDKKLDDDGYRITLAKHGDLEYLYEIDFGREDGLTKTKALAAVRCWPLRFDWDGDWKDYDELKEKEINLFDVKTKIEAEEAGA